MFNFETVKTFLADNYPQAILIDGFDEALVGICERIGQESIALYDKTKILNILINGDKMSRDEADEYFEYNIIGAYVGEGTPAFVTYPQYL